MLSGHAFAQASAGEAPQTSSVSEVVVTGTLIPGVAPTEEIVTVSAEDIKLTAATNTYDVLETLPALSNFEQSFHPTVQGAESGVFNASIRNLLTLVLIDGRRVPPSGTLSTQPDPNSIPAIALQRVEVDPGGASALYGSDAVGGVINFITRKNFNGVEANVQYGVADSYSSWDAAILAGRTWSSGSALLAYEYTSNTDLNGLQRPDYSIGDLTPYGGPDNRSTACTLPNVTVGATTYAFPALAPGTVNRCDKTRIADLLWASHRHAVFGNIHQSLTPNIEVWAQGNYSDHRSSGLVAPLDAVVTIPNTNPFFQPVPGTNATSESVSFSAQDLLGIKFFTDHTKNQSGEITAGVNAKLPRDWELKAYLNYGRSFTQGEEVNSLNQAALGAAAAGTTASTALDPFGSDTSPAVVQAIGNWNYITSTTQTLEQAVATADGALFSLPGGEVKLAAGGEVRREEFSATFINGPAGSAPAASVSPKRTVYSFFGELRVPLVGEANALPLVRALNVSASGRYDHYSDFGSTTNPMVGVDWTVVRGLKLRANWNTSFHAPSLSDLNAIDGKFVSVGFPFSAAFFGTDPLMPGPYNAYVVAGGNPGLKPETARTWQVGADFDRIPNLRLSFTYYNIDEKNIITIPPLSNAIFGNPAFEKFIFRNATPAQIAQFEDGLPFVDLVPINPALPITIFDLRRQNLASLSTDGLDFSGQYALQSSFGRFVLGEVAERVLSYSEAPAPGAPPADLLMLGFPAWHSRTTLTWNYRRVTASVAENYNGAYTNEASLAAGLVTFQLPAVVTTDLFFSYLIPAHDILSGVELTLKVSNVFDASPPIGPLGPRTDVNVIGREALIGLHTTF
jgi:iron complex outermembrane receptor protein